MREGLAGLLTGEGAGAAACREAGDTGRRERVLDTSLTLVYSGQTL